MSKKKKPLWTLEDNGITFSALSKWMECPEQFSLQWIDGLTSRKVSIPLEFGSVMHYMLQNQFASNPKDVAERICEQYYKHRSQSLKDFSDRSTLQYVLGLAKATFPHYCRRWQHDDAKINWIGREEKFEVKHNCYGRDIILRGMRDGMYEIPSEDVFGIFETKTKSRIVESEIVDCLHGDMQTLFYCYSTYLSQGKYPNQVKYNVIRRSDLYRKKGEKLEPYLNRVENDIISRPDHYFKRWSVWLSQKDIDNFVQKSLNPVLNLFCEWWDSVKKNSDEEGRWQSKYHFQNYNALVGKYGKAEVWDAIFGNRSRYQIRTEVYPELEDSFQVTWEQEDEVQVPRTDSGTVLSDSSSSDDEG